MAKSFNELSPTLKRGVQSAEGWDGENYHIKTEDGIVVLGMEEVKGEPMYSVAGEKASTKKAETNTDANDNSTLTVAEIKEKLTALAIEIPTGANKAELVALLDEAEKASK